ncbi:hypothetical protein Cagg_2124 [Chloroflexus aggregans DSM 9485]|uniref:Uncharacterized protein n=1 Tax=Chloroflexus aggregans (strain MD-66 / DSM 9485) TaxID=326427 RepID=B8GCG6_CHLAD|nr:hypothetical protein Cagg_2124 [Chloroflexus aggregans DSM 9485]
MRLSRRSKAAAFRRAVVYKPDLFPIADWKDPHAKPLSDAYVAIVVEFYLEVGVIVEIKELLSADLSRIDQLIRWARGSCHYSYLSLK